jgi:hypothetical protein
VQPIDYIALARAQGREAFVADHPFPFLVGDDARARPPGPQPTVCGAEYPEIQRFLAGGPPPAPRPLPAAEAMVLAVHKVTTAFPSMITIGRTSNHDVVLSDIKVSKFHAFIRENGRRFELVDAGSSNGTWVGDRRLQKREGYVLQVGDEVRFGQLRLQFLDAARCWETLRQRDAVAPNLSLTAPR